MEHKELKFSTNLNCGGCVSKVQPDLDSAAGIDKWTVDTDSIEKILTIQSAGITADEVAAIIKNKGFKIEPLNA